jgi:hypothetical protein
MNKGDKRREGAIGDRHKDSQRRDRSPLFAYTEKRFNRLHNCNRWTRDAVVFHLFKIFFEALNFDDCVVSLAVIVTAQPKGDIIRIRNCIAPELLAGNLRDIDRDLRLRGRDCKTQEYQV